MASPKPATGQGGDDAFSFDDIVEAPSPLESQVPTEAVQTEDGEIVDTDEANRAALDDDWAEEAEEQVDEDEGDDEEEAEEEASSEKEKDDEEEDEPEEEVEKAAKKDVKTYKVKNGEADVDLRSDTKVTVKIRGEEVDVDLQELMNNYSGKVDYTKKYQELNHEKNLVERDKNKMQNYVNDLYKTLAVEKDVTGTIWKLSEAMGADPVEVLTQFQSQIMGQVDRYANMSPEERRAVELDEKKALLDRQQKQSLAEAEAKKAQEEMAKRVQKVQQETELSLDQLSELYYELQDMGVAEADLTPENIALYHKEVEMRGAIKGLLDGVGSGLNEAEVGDAIEELRNLWVQNPDYSVEDMKDIALGVYGSKKARVLSKKLNKSKATKTKVGKRVAPQHEDVFSFDDL